jgi:hypothetical protein
MRPLALPTATPARKAGKYVSSRSCSLTTASKLWREKPSAFSRLYAL